MIHARDLLSSRIVSPRLVTAALAVAFTCLVPLFLVASLPAALHAAPRQVSCPAGSVLYVDKYAAGTQTGTSWSDAFVHLQDALATAAACPSVQQIWVAQGVYYPDEGSGQTDNSVTSTFAVPPGLSLYGGFAATETQLSQRSWASHVTVLSGDIGGNDTDADGNAIAENSGHIQGLNAYHVVLLNGTGVTPVDPATRIDGFTITAGSASGYTAGDTSGGGLYCKGGGRGKQCSPTIANVVFTGNKASYYGGAVFDDGSNGGLSSPTIANVVFAGNSAGYNGGALYNNAAATGGVSSPTLTNVIFYANSAGNGGGLYNYGYNGESKPALTNVIFWGNTASASGSQMYNAFAAPVVRYSLVQGGITGGGISNYMGTLTDGGGNGSGDPLFVAALRGDLRTLPGSAARDAGDNNGAPLTDIRGLPRPVNAVVDIGAYEAQGYLLMATSGDKQNVPVNSDFPLPLALTLSSPYEWMAPRSTITFTPPVAGPGLSVTAPWTVTVDANGAAAVSVRGNGLAGQYTVSATVPGAVTPATFTLTNTPLYASVARSGSGSGTVISSPAGVVCAPICTAGFDYGRVVTFTATAGPGSTFSGWIDDGGRIGGALSDPATGAALPSSGTISVTMTTSRAITATFSAPTQPPGPTPVPTPDPTPDPGPGPDPGPAPGPPDPTVVDRLYLPAVAKP